MVAAIAALLLHILCRLDDLIVEVGPLSYQRARITTRSDRFLYGLKLDQNLSVRHLRIYLELVQNEAKILFEDRPGRIALFVGAKRVLSVSQVPKAEGFLI